MIQLDRHIEILLLDNDCVIVPNFGGFVAHHVEARYDESEFSFLPPIRTLGFNPHLKNINDSLLAQSYVEAYDISYPEAQRIITQEVDQLREKLFEAGIYALKNIGNLYINDTGDIVFEPCEAGILTPELYGLGTFEMKKLLSESSQNKPESKPVQKLPHPMGIIPEQAEAPVTENGLEHETDEAVQDAETFDEFDESERTISIKVSWIRNIAVAAATIVAFFILSTPVTNSIEGKMFVSDIGTGLLTKIADLDTHKNPKGEVKGNADDKVKKAVEAMSKSRLDSAQKAKADVNVADTTKKSPTFCIVLASQVTMRGADNFVKTLKKEGLDKSYTYINNKVVRVVYGRYDTEEQALQELKIVRGNKYFEQAWIYKMTH
ncbi:MAG: SPOR domain-containing protein [Prevotella sp.]